MTVRFFQKKDHFAITLFEMANLGLWAEIKEFISEYTFPSFNSHYKM